MQRVEIEPTPAMGAGTRGVVAVSGGLDSMVLLHWLATSWEKSQLVVAHLDHGLHADSAAMADFVRHRASELGVEAVIEQTPVRSTGAGVEAEARRVRYDFLARTAAACGATWVAVAHNADDQAETLLLRIVRGTGVDGLAGMRRERDLEGVVLCRPLLGFSRAQLRDWAEANEVTWREDPTNADVRFSRNRIRHEVIPVLEQVNPKVRSALTRLAEVAARDAGALQAMDAELLSQVEGEAGLWVAELQALPRPWQARVVRLWLTGLRGRSPSAAEVERVVTESEPDGPSREVHLDDGLKLRCEGGRWAEAEPVAAPEPVTLEAGRNELTGYGLAVLWPASAGAEIVVQLDVTHLKTGLLVSPPHPGDRMRPRGLGGSKKLQDLLVDRKIPRSQRKRVAVMRAGDRILAVLSPLTGRLLAVDERACTPGRDHLSLEVVPSGQFVS